MGEDFERAAAEAKRPAHRRARPRALAAVLSSSFQSLGASHQTVEAHGFDRAKRQSATARLRSRSLIRAKSSPFTTPYSPLTNHASLFTNHGPLLTNHDSRITNLPGTVTRVETHLSHRKQTTGHASTRNVPAHGYFRVLFARAPAIARAESKPRVEKGKDAKLELGAPRQSAGGPPALQEESRSLVGHKAASVGMTIVNQGCGARRDRIRDDTCGERCSLAGCDRVEVRRLNFIYARAD